MWKAFLPPSLFLGSLFLFIILLFLLPVEVRITIDNLRKDKSISLQLIILFWGKVKLRQIKRIFPAAFQINSFLEQCNALVKEKEEWYKSGKAQLQKTAGAVYHLMRTAIWKKFDLKVKLGSGDPAWTALLTGFLRYLSGRGSPHVLRLLSFKKGKRPLFLFYPSFLEREYIFLLSVEFTVSGLKLIYYSVKIFCEIILGLQRLNLRRRSGKWQSIQSKV